MLSNDRDGKVTASVVGAILGLKGAFTNRKAVKKALVLSMLGRSPKSFSSQATEHGNNWENYAIAKYLQQSEFREVRDFGDNQKFYEKDGWLGATPDGSVAFNGLIEVKCPFKERYTEASESYYAQMQIQMLCAGKEWCDFVVFFSDTDEIHVTRYPLNEVWLLSNLPKLKAFWDECNEIATDMDKAEAFLNEQAERDDTPWAKECSVYISLQATMAEYQKLLDESKARLIELSGGKAVKGSGVQIIVSEREGSVKYAEAIKVLAPDADLTPWRGKPSTVTTIKTY
jgi:hypothetical protein